MNTTPNGGNILSRAALVAVTLALPLAVKAENITFPADSGVLDVTKAPYNAIPNDGKDDTVAIQAALNAYPNGGRIIYLPNGTYNVSDTLSWPAGVVGGSEYKNTIMQGQSKAGVVIKLVNGAAGFSNPASPKAVIFTGPAPAQRFRNAIRNLTVNTGTGNPGASGIQFNASNQGGLRSVSIVSGDGTGVAGLDMAFTSEIGPMLIRDLSVTGFSSGIRTGDVINSMTLENVTLKNQKRFGIWNVGQIMTIRGLTSTNSVPAIVNGNPDDPGSVLGWFGVVTLLDATLTGTGTASTLPAISNDGTVYARNVSAPGYAQAIAVPTHGNGIGAAGPTVAEYASDNIASLNGAPQRSMMLPVKSTPDVAWDALSAWANPMSYGAIGDGVADDTAAIQAAIDSGNTTVYFPGDKKFCINGTLLVRGAVRRITGLEGKLCGSGRIKFINGTSSTVVFERCAIDYGSPLVLEHAASRTVVLSSLLASSIVGSGTGDFFLDDLSAYPFVFSNKAQNIWARQINPEGEDQAKVQNQGAKLWILGLKTERGNIIVDTSAGGATELLGAHIFNTTNLNGFPMFRVTDSHLTVAGVGETVFNGNYYQTIVQDTTSGATQTLARGGVPTLRVNSSTSIPLFSDFAPAAAPTNLAASSIGRTSLTLTWTDNSTNETGYEVERSTAGGAFTRIASLGANTTARTVTGLSSVTTYSFRVRAINQSGASAYSNTITLSTL